MTTTPNASSSAKLTSDAIAFPKIEEPEHVRQAAAARSAALAQQRQSTVYLRRYTLLPSATLHPASLGFSASRLSAGKNYINPDSNLSVVAFDTPQGVCESIRLFSVVRSGEAEGEALGPAHMVLQYSEEEKAAMEKMQQQRLPQENVDTDDDDDDDEDDEGGESKENKTKRPFRRRWRWERMRQLFTTTSTSDAPSGFPAPGTTFASVPIAEYQQHLCVLLPLPLPCGTLQNESTTTSTMNRNQSSDTKINHMDNPSANKTTTNNPAAPPGSPQIISNRNVVPATLLTAPLATLKCFSATTGTHPNVHSSSSIAGYQSSGSERVERDGRSISGAWRRYQSSQMSEAKRADWKNMDAMEAEDAEAPFVRRAPASQVLGSAGLASSSSSSRSPGAGNSGSGVASAGSEEGQERRSDIDSVGGHRKPLTGKKLPPPSSLSSSNATEDGQRKRPRGGEAGEGLSSIAAAPSHRIAPAAGDAESAARAKMARVEGESDMPASSSSSSTTAATAAPPPAARVLNLGLGKPVLAKIGTTRSSSSSCEGVQEENIAGIAQSMVQQLTNGGQAPQSIPLAQFQKSVLKSLPSFPTMSLKFKDPSTKAEANDWFRTNQEVLKRWLAENGYQVDPTGLVHL